MRSWLTRGLALTAALVVGLIAVGCGGDDAPTKSEYIADADAICKQGDKEIEATADETFTQGKEPSEAEITSFAEDTVIPNVQGQVDDLRDLTPPDGDEDTVNAIYDAAQEALDEIEADPAIFLTNQDPFEGANKLAQDYGLKVCGRS